MSTNYCPLPFRHVFVDSTGISPCCEIGRDFCGHHGNIETWHENKTLKEIQQTTLSGHWHRACKNCRSQEQDGHRSLRQRSLEDYHNEVFTETQIDFVDYRSNNICNFRCRSCEPAFSHGIAAEVRNNQSLQKFLPIIEEKTVSVTDSNVQWILKNAGQLKRLMFTGGEPTRMPEVRKIIETVNISNPNINILITTNGSFNDPYWKDITQSMPNLHWTLSLDAVGSPAELIRHGTDWTTVSENARWLANNAQSFSVNTVVSNLSVFHLAELMMFVRGLQKETTMPNGSVHQFHVIQKPNFLAADNLSPELAEQAKQHLLGCAELDLDDDQRSVVERLIAIFSDFLYDPLLWEKSLEYQSALDAIRNEDHLKLLSR